MRVLAVGNVYPPAGFGGYERTWAGVMAALRAAGHEVRVLTTAPGAAPEPADGDPAGTRDELYVHRTLRWYWREHAFPERSLRDRLAVERHNARVVREHLGWRPDVVSWWGMGGMSLSLIEQVRRAGVPAVGQVGDGWMVYGFEADKWIAGWRRRRRIAGAAERLLGIPTRVDLGAAALWLFNSRATRDRALQEHALPRTGVVHPGVDGRRFGFRPAGPWSWRLAVIGRVERAKGVGVAVQALAQLPAEARLAITGDGDPGHVAELRRRAAELSVGDRVSLERAEADGVVQAYAAADAVLFPVTWPEPWGLVPLEAMSVGRPVVATGTGGSGEYLADGRNCLLVPPDDPGALAAAVRRLAGDPELRERLVAAGRETAARYSEAAFETAMVAALEAEARNGLTASRPGSTS